MNLLARHREYAEATFRKDARLNIRISSKDLRGLQRRALAAYGESILRDLQKAIYAMQNRPGRLERCMQVMAMTLPKAVLWQKIRALKRVLPRSSPQSTTA